jgi:carbamoyl-phosphate synthase large subunit
MVTGVGAIIGYGVLRALRPMREEIRLVGTDIYADAIGQAWADAFVQAPLTADPSYPEWLERTIREQRVDLVIPAIEQDVHFFSDHRDLFVRAGVGAALNTAALIDLTRDKWAMDQALVSMNSPVRIPTRLDGDFSTLVGEFGLPFLLKPRRSYASKGLIRVRDEVDFARHRGQLGSVLMAQPIVGTDDEEYTVSVFGDGSGQVCASINLQRRLAQDGSTAKAWLRHDVSLDATVARLCETFMPVGPTNLQFRKTEGGWKLLEINPRVSSTTSLRAAFGYNEARMCVDYFLDGRAVTQPTVRQGFAMRYIEDFVVYDRNHF